MWSNTRRYFSASDSVATRRMLPLSAGTRWPLRSQNARIFSGMSPGLAKTGSSGSMNIARSSQSIDFSRSPSRANVGAPSWAGREFSGWSRSASSARLIPIRA